MKLYHVYYGTVLVGELYCDGEKFKYDANHAELEKLVSQGEPISPVLLQDQKEFGAAIPYFKVRIDSNSRFENLEIGFVTDKVRLREVVNREDIH